MKKLLVLAAVAAMAFGAKAEYTYTVTIPGAQAVYGLETDRNRSDVVSWGENTIPAFTDADGALLALGNTWGERYAALEGIYGNQGFKFENLGEGSFSLGISDQGIDGSYVGLVVLLDSDVFAPGKNYACYIGQFNGDVITVENSPIATGTLLTDPSAVPEPTSGLLMLLGVAGLALKRKRA